jgi:CheY-like chemotaxis protein
MAKILVVDDEPLLRTMMGDALAEGGHKVITADSGSACIELARNDPPACILLDIIMPGLDGYETCDALKADPQLAGIPVFLVSATKDLHVVDRAESVGAVGVLPKPVPTEELLHAVALVLAGRPSQ